MAIVLDIHDFPLFIITGVLLNLTPGPDMLYIIGRSTAQGMRAGAAAALGIGAGCLVHILAAVLGLSALLTASAAAFTLIKIIGAVYLVYLGISLLITSDTRRQGVPGGGLVPDTVRAVFIQGFFTNVLNPKVALFFLAFVPQFIDTDASHKALAFLILGLVFNCNGTVLNLIVAWFAARTGAVLKGGRFITWVNRCIGGFFVYLGIRLALDERN